MQLSADLSPFDNEAHEYEDMPGLADIICPHGESFRNRSDGHTRLPANFKAPESGECRPVTDDTSAHDAAQNSLLRRSQVTVIEKVFEVQARGSVHVHNFLAACPRHVYFVKRN